MVNMVNKVDFNVVYIFYVVVFVNIQEQDQQKLHFDF